MKEGLTGRFSKPLDLRDVVGLARGLGELRAWFARRCRAVGRPEEVAVADVEGVVIGVDAALKMEERRDDATDEGVAVEAEDE